jgi:predicted permease
MEWGNLLANKMGGENEFSSHFRIVGQRGKTTPALVAVLAAYFFLAGFFAGASFFTGAAFFAGAAFLAASFLTGAFLAGAFFTGIKNPPFHPQRRRVTKVGSAFDRSVVGTNK